MKEYGICGSCKKSQIMGKRSTSFAICLSTNLALDVTDDMNFCSKYEAMEQKKEVKESKVVPAKKAASKPKKKGK
jgi:hypothetical protein